MDKIDDNDSMMLVTAFQNLKRPRRVLSDFIVKLLFRFISKGVKRFNEDLNRV